MNLFVIALLALAAFYFLMSDMLSLAVVCVAGLVIVLYYYSSGDNRALQAHGAHAGAHGSAQSEGPMVVQLGHKRKPHPELYRVRIYPSWENRSAWEELGKQYLGPLMNTLGSTAYRVASGKHAEKGLDMQPDETFRGR
ncbi:MAG: hypothetical protein V1817_02170 [Candidatus Micrarchaeota archaeon]